MAKTKKKTKKNKPRFKDSVKYRVSTSKNSNFGEYNEDRGGGTPVGPSTKYSGDKGRGAYTRLGQPGHRDEEQPRTDDGKFTYNAVNGKELKEISKVHGKSRGTTVPPTLTGGVNGIQYYKSKKVPLKDKNGNIVKDKNGNTVYRENGPRDFKGGNITDNPQNFTEAELKAFANALAFDTSKIYTRADRVINYKGEIAIPARDFMEAAQEYKQSDKEKAFYTQIEAKLNAAIIEEFKDKTATSAEIRKFRSEKKKELIKADKALPKSQRSFGTGEFVEDKVSSWKETKQPQTPSEAIAVDTAKKHGWLGKLILERGKPIRKGDEQTIGDTKKPSTTPSVSVPKIDKNDTPDEIVDKVEGITDELDSIPNEEIRQQIRDIEALPENKRNEVVKLLMNEAGVSMGDLTPSKIRDFLITYFTVDNK